jgi:hypothetical protein
MGIPDVLAHNHGFETAAVLDGKLRLREPSPSRDADPITPDAWNVIHWTMVSTVDLTD